MAIVTPPPGIPQDNLANPGEGGLSRIQGLQQDVIRVLQKAVDLLKRFEALEKPDSAQNIE